MRRTPTSAYLVALSLALGLSAAGAQVATTLGADTIAQGQAALNTVTVVDVPADHWARQAVTIMVSRGLITGFPDGTFRGDQPLTRYQAALILARALPQLNMQSLSADEQTVIYQALDGLRAELKLIQQQVQVLSGLITTQQQQLDLLTKDKADAARVAALEQQLALLQAQVALLSGQYTTVGTQVDALSARAAAEALGTAPVVQTPAAAVAAQPDVAFVTSPEVPSNLKSEAFAVGAFGAVGGVAAQGGVSLDYRFSRNSPVYLQLYGQTSIGDVKASGLGLNAVYDFGKAGQDLKPYAFAGLGAVISEAWATTGTATDLYGRAGAGAEYRVADTFSVFGDGYVNYYASNRGIGTGLGQTAKTGVGVGGRLGVKLRF